MARCARAGATEHMCSGRTFLWDSRALRTARTHALFKQLLDVELKERAALALPLQIIGLYGILLREHCAEYRALYVLGARKRDIRRLVVRESLLLGASGACVGCLFALAVGVLFSPALQNALGLPYLAPAGLHTALLFLAVLLIAGLLAPCSAVLSLRKQERAEYESRL